MMSRVRWSEALSRLRVSSMVALLACASCGGRSLVGDAAVSSPEGSAAETDVIDVPSDDGMGRDESVAEVSAIDTSSDDASSDDASVTDGAVIEVPGMQIASCDPADLTPGTADRLAGLDLANGPPPTAGDFVRATIEGQSYDFSTKFDAPTITSGDGTARGFARGWGQNLSNMTVSPAAGGAWRLGPSDCTSFSLGFANPAVGLEHELWYSSNCCFLNVTKLATAQGDTFEGTFSGVVLAGPNKLRITDGAFRVTAASP
jgi:hypothetical protein